MLTGISVAFRFDHQPKHANDVPTHALPICALHGGNIESGNGRNTTLIYFGRYAAGETILPR
ncbi:hypothetical protein [Photobacterium leiognathi]|uniref:hypothetical protein n=1 Tax=Photobacterium leiognathi TaxID=553611 RepID=UPI00273914EA|nr:hypothetical protein [Photobacterium leiognathi]